MPKKPQIEQNVKKRGSKTSQNHIHIYIYVILTFSSQLVRRGTQKAFRVIYIYIYVEHTFQSQNLRWFFFDFFSPSDPETRKMTDRNVLRWFHNSLIPFLYTICFVFLPYFKLIAIDTKSDIFTTFFIYYFLPVFFTYFKLIDSYSLIHFYIPFALFSSPILNW